MKQTRTFHKIIALVALMTMVFSFAACGIVNKGSLQLKSFTVDRTSIKTSYLVGEEIDFSGIRATVKYSDESLNKVYTYSELTITYADDITATVGEKEVSVSFDDPNLNVKQETKVKITVSEELSSDAITYPALAVEFARPTSIVHFNSANSSAGKTEYGAAGFASEFLEGNKVYVVGNENEFKLNPSFAVFDNKGEIVAQPSFYSTVELSIHKDGAYVALTAQAGDNNMVSFYDGETLMATVDTFNGTYQFSKDAADHEFNISVLPSKDYYIYDSFPAITLEVSVINAYNVYEAWQLAVIDTNYLRNDWDEIKTANGIADLYVNGIVLHNDIKVTANDVPANFFHTSTKDTVYTNAVTGEETVIPAGTKFLDDVTEIYYRLGTADFVMEGNFFTIDVSAFPLVASPAVFGADADLDYGSDFSNATLFKFESYENHEVSEELKSNGANVSIANLSIKGNAKRDNLLDADENLASAGGLIFIKSTTYTNMSINNTIGNSFFITYFADYGGNMTLNHAKCYDSYQNAAMVWGDSNMEVNNSFFNGCGGPAVISQSVIDNGWYPNTVFNNTVVDTSLSGEEIWFDAVKATPIVSNIKALGMGLGQTGFGSFVDSNGQMNIQLLLMASGNDATAVATRADAQGLIKFDDNVLDRYMTNPLWQGILTHPALALGAPFLSVVGADGNTYVIYFDGTTFCDIYGNALGTDASHQYYAAAFMASDSVILTQGGLSVVFELYH